MFLHVVWKTMVFAEVFTRPLPKTLVLRSFKHVARSKIMCNNIVNYNVFFANGQMPEKCSRIVERHGPGRNRWGGGEGGGPSISVSERSHQYILSTKVHGTPFVTFRPSGATKHWKKTRCFATFLPFCAPASSFLWLFLFSDLLRSHFLFSDSSHLRFSICPLCWKFDF